MRAVIILIALGLLSASCTKKDEQQPAPKVENLQKAPPSYDYSGSGFKNAEMSLEKGTVTITYAYTDPGEFVVWLTSTDNSDSHLIANIKGPKTDMVKVDIPKDGNYILNIQTQGNYTISIREKQIGQ